MNAHSFFSNEIDGLPRLRDAAPSDIGAALAASGAAILEGAIEPGLLRQIKAELTPWFEAAFQGEGPFFGTRTRRFGGLFAKSPACAALAIHPIALNAIETLLKGPLQSPYCDAIELNLCQAIGIEPGEAPQYLHRDEELWPLRASYELMANVMWTLDDFTEENGATRLIPGSHLWPRDREPTPGESRQAIAPAGSAIFWLGGVLHGGGANLSNQTRHGVVISYRLAWLAPTEKLLLSTPPEIARALPAALQRLLGYQLHRPNLGWVEGRDPIEWLHGKTKDLAPAQDNLSVAQQALLGKMEKEPELFAGRFS